ncbi:MAG TPA: iron ABC transporter permease [Acidimicrobiales bacterium]|nr:iron ABC transporter permease [Acidimicrobiales bacterium]
MTGGASPTLVGVCGVVGLLFAAPLLYLVRENLAGSEDLVDLYTSARTLGPLRNTLVLAVATAASASVVGTGLAWLTTRSDLPLRRFWAAVTPLPLVFPSFVGALGLVAALSPGGLLESPLGWVGVDPTRPEGFWGAWLVLTLFTTPYVLLPVAARLVSLPPSLEESARLLGRGPWAVFRTVVLPQLRSSILAGALLVFLYAVSDFGVVVLLRFDTLTRAIHTNRLFNADRSAALSLLLAVVALAVVAAERTVSRRARDVDGVRTKQPLRVPLGRGRWPAFGLVVVWTGLALGGPLASLGLWAWRGLAGEGSDLSGAGEGLGGLRTPAGNSAAIGMVTALVAVAVVLPLAYLSARHRAAAGDAANGLVAAGFALPGLVVALAVVSFALDLPESWGLYESFTLLVFAYVVHLGAQSLRAAQVAVAAVPRRLDESARMLGAGRVRRFGTIELPLMVPGLAAGAGLVLLSTMKELPITLLVAPTGFETLSTRIWADAESGFLAEAGLASIVLVALSGVLTWLLVTRRTERLA